MRFTVFPAIVDRTPTVTFIHANVSQGADSSAHNQKQSDFRRSELGHVSGWDVDRR